MTATKLTMSRLAVQERDAWLEYLEVTRGVLPESYPDVEPWAWARLGTTLRAIRRERRRLIS